MDATRSLELALRAIAKGAADLSAEHMTYQLPAGVIMATKVKLIKITDLVFDEAEITYYVVRCGNPDRVVLATENQAEALAAFQGECRYADQERQRWIEDRNAARR